MSFLSSIDVFDIQRENIALKAEIQVLKNQLCGADFIPKACLRYALEHDPVDSVILCLSEARQMFLDAKKH